MAAFLAGRPTIIRPSSKHTATIIFLHGLGRSRYLKQLALCPSLDVPIILHYKLSPSDTPPLLMNRRQRPKPVVNQSNLQVCSLLLISKCICVGANTAARPCCRLMRCLTPIRRLPHVKWIFPSAPTRPISLNGGASMPGEIRPILLTSHLLRISHGGRGRTLRSKHC